MQETLTQTAADANETPGQRLLHMKVDRRILVITLSLMAIGISLVLSSSSFFAGGKFGDQFALMRNHAVRSFIALVVMFVASRIDYRVYRKAAPALLVLSVLMMLALFFLGVTIRDTRRWMILPLINTTLQPSELARTALVFFLAYWMTRTGKDLTRFKTGFLPAAGAIALVAGICAALPNFGTATATIVIALCMLYVGGARLAHIGMFVGAGAALFIVEVLRHAYVRDRILTFLGFGHGSGALNWQVDQSLIALGSGGLFGRGFGHNQQNLSWNPHTNTDNIYTNHPQDPGLLLTLAVSGAFLFLALRGLKIAHDCSDRFGQLLGVGITASVFVYAALNMYVATGLFPVTGLPLPFLSYGGSAMLVNAFAVGVMLNLSRKLTGPRRRTNVMWEGRLPVAAR